MNTTLTENNEAQTNTEDSEPVAELQCVNQSYGSTSVLRSLDWQLFPGQVVGLLGRNGSGKTTLLETLLGLREPQSGKVSIFGSEVQQIDDAARARIGYVPQQSDLFEEFTPTQLLDYFRSFYPKWNDEKVENLMSRWDIPRHTFISKLSGGQQQRLSIIRALAHEPELLVLDEPVASLDPVGRRDFLRELVEQVLNHQCTVVFSTHILSDLERVAFNLAFMHDGRIVLQAPLDELLEQSFIASGSTAELIALQTLHNGKVLRRQSLHDDYERWLIKTSDGIPKANTSLIIQPVSLEDLYMELT